VPVESNLITTTHAIPNPFDPAALRLSGDFAALGVKKKLLKIPVSKPDKAWFVRTHPDDAYRLETCLLVLKEEREFYLVAPALWPDLAGEPTFAPQVLSLGINRQGVLFFWPVRLAGPDGKPNSWNESALEAAGLARDHWVRVTANLSLGAYEVHEATGDFPAPEWPDAPMRELLEIAFRGKRIDSPEHPVLRKLRGEV
jgi:hypothetical protein